MSEQSSPASGKADEVDGGAGEKQRTRTLGGIAKWVFVLFTAAAVLLSINQLFNLQFFAGVVVLEGRYLFLLAGLFLSLTFLSFPLRGEPGSKVAWYDWILAALGAAVAGYFAYTAETNLEEGWEYAPPETARWMSILFWLLILEATRRAGGLVIFGIVFVFSLYPTFADVMPGPISGFAQPFMDAIPYHIISSESSFGIPMRAFGNLVIGFIIFGAALQFTGGGAFFNNLALALVGNLRGGAAKVAIFASGFMGSLSGSVISNVLTTGAISIPAMKKTGFPARYAARTEACASTGGVLVPPVMGTTAFVMASFLGRPYLEIAAAAAIPSLLYYFGLFVQIDAYAARHNLRGIPREQLPSISETLKEGWYYLFVFALLIFLMMVMRQETWAPFFATGLLLVINQISKKHRFDLKGFFNLIYSIGLGLTELVAVLLGIGLIVGAFSATGLAGTLVNDLIFLAGGSVFMLLVMGAITSFIFGMGMTVTACYIFLAVVLAPALVKAGLNELAVHLFILYWGMVSYITPPVALGAFAAATMARTNALAAGLEAMRLGSIIYFVPFFFVLNPALIGEGSWTEVLVVLATAVFGVYLLCSALQGYVAGFGRLGTGPVALGAKILLLLGGLFFAAPGDVIPGVSHLQMGMIGALLAAPVLFYARMNRRREAALG
ncbi:TRAP transporter permease [Nisaea sediminum]|uniref:TRAP transporter permease n=1 Tax=Nisaea sediminum TaxID=2775867 RepID=UPI001865AD20|nr:TRAP transporter fused permease subunit [Nisaea sediminum]